MMTIIFGAAGKLLDCRLVSDRPMHVPRIKELVKIHEVMYKVVSVMTVIRNHNTSEITEVNEPYIYVELRSA